MPTLEELSAIDPDLLAAALYCAQKREREAKLGTLPKCRCGARATQIVRPQITYTLAPIYTDEEQGSARVGRWEEEDWGGGAPGPDEPDTDVMWVCCDNTQCVDASWKAVSYGDLNGLSGL